MKSSIDEAFGNISQRKKGLSVAKLFFRVFRVFRGLFQEFRQSPNLYPYFSFFF